MFPTISFRLSQQFNSLRKLIQGALPIRNVKSTAGNVKQLRHINSREARTVKSNPRLVEGTVVADTTSLDLNATKEVFRNVNTQISSGTHGRLFAVIYIHGKQFKVTPEDVIVIQSNMPVDVGDSLRLEKVLLVGSRDFTLLGRPLLSRELVRVDATVIEKTLSQQVRNFIFKKRSRYQRHYLYRFPFTMLRINSIELLHLVNEGPAVETVREKFLY